MLSLRHVARRLPVLSRALSHQASRAVAATTSTSSHESTAFTPTWGWMGMAAIVSTLGAASAACKAQPEPAKEVEHDVVLDHEAKGVFSTPIAGIKSYSCASYKANFPIEDRFAVHADKHAVYAAIFDGHGGWQVAEYAQNHLIENAKAELAIESAQTANKIESALEQAFLRTDFDLKEIVRGAFQLGFGQVNRVGACSMLAYVTDNLLVVANAGDERAVLGSFENDNLIAIPMSNDHNAKLPVEMARLAREHPGEDNIVVCKHPESCYVKGGLQPTRALGDFAFKDVDFNAPAVPTRRGGGRHIAPPYTPPYVLAKPDVQTHTVTGADKFLILGSDGVWDFLTNQEAVEIVHHYVSRGEAHLASRAVVELVLAKVAELRGMDIEDLLEVAPGKPRRRLHDDTTVVVLVFS